MGVLLPRTQINSMLRDVTWRDVTQHLLHAVPWLIFFWNFWIIRVRCRVSYICWTILYARWKNTDLKKEESLFKKGRLWLGNLRKKILKCFPHTYENQLLDYGRANGTNQCICQHKAELNTKTAAQLSSGEVWGVQHN